MAIRFSKKILKVIKTHNTSLRKNFVKEKFQHKSETFVLKLPVSCIKDLERCIWQQITFIQCLVSVRMLKKHFHLWDRTIVYLRMLRTPFCIKSFKTNNEDTNKSLKAAPFSPPLKAPKLKQVPLMSQWKETLFTSYKCSWHSILLESWHVMPMPYTAGPFKMKVKKRWLKL